MNPAASLYDNLMACVPVAAPKDPVKLYTLIGELSTAQTLAKSRADKEALGTAMRVVDVIINTSDPVWTKIIRVYPPAKMK